jgi:hypothetical protein
VDEPVTLKTLLIVMLSTAVIAAGTAIAVSSAVIHNNERTGTGVAGPIGPTGPQGPAGPRGPGGARGAPGASGGGGGGGSEPDAKKICEGIEDAAIGAEAGSVDERIFEELKNKAC